MVRPSQSAELLSRVDADGEVPLGAYGTWILAAAGAGSPLHGLVITNEMRAMDDDEFLARLTQAREELGPHAPATNGQHGNGDAVASEGLEGVEEFELPRPLNFIVAARRQPAYIGIAYVADRDDEVAPQPELRVGWRGIERVLHGVLGEDGRVGVLEERRDPRGIHEFFLRSPAAEAAALYDHFVARPALAEGQVLSVHVFHPDETQPRHQEIRLTHLEDGAQTTESAADDGTGWAQVRTGSDAQAGWIELVSDTLAVPR